MPVTTSLAAALGAGRALLGAALLVAPAPILRSWVGRDDAPAALLGRAVGARDLALGAGAVLAAAGERDLAPWLAAGLLADLGDAAATLAAGDAIPRSGRLGTVALAGASAALGLALLARLRD
jgi:hypothetical protein